jgi:N-acetylglucosaminyl-diphospho-decaprenol L-rhamnosyltransferase
MPEADPTVSFIIVNWNTADMLCRCLDSIGRHVGIRHETIVVDNDSADGSVDRVRRGFPGVRVIPAGSNLGFARANNLGLAAARGRYLFLLNPDTAVRPGAVESVIAHLEAHPDAGIAGPTLWNPDGSIQGSVQRRPSLRTEFVRQTMLHRVLHRRGDSVRVGGPTRRVDVVTGAALCITRVCFERIGPMDGSIFLFYEDTDWCCRAADAGFGVWFVECAGVLHEKGAASGGEARTRTLLDSLRGTILFFRKHHGGGSIAALRAIALAGATARGLRAAALWTLGRNRSEQRARLKAYGRMIGWAVRGGAL